MRRYFEESDGKKRLLDEMVRKIVRRIVSTVGSWRAGDEERQISLRTELS